ncbi:class I SAM-dependent methyltransferase [uncultured Roseivirga sp.]|uniref:class I SAM-dependent methyltransferase n=1 Tax=uncultured Roseivirga sp. TaxID=543088 RepID=UPI0030D73094
MKERIDMEGLMVCPFTKKPLRQMKEKELVSLNAQIKQGDLFFYPGAPVNIEISAALVTANQTYVYPIIDNISYLQRQTAIVAKNRTANHLRRVSKEEIDQFYKTYGFGEGNTIQKPSKELKSNPISEEKITQLARLLPKGGEYFMSVVTHDVDSIHNLTYGRSFKYYFHMDFSLPRLLAMKNELPGETILVLGDVDHLPFDDDSVEALFSFDYINNYNKEVQGLAYEELKRCLKPDGVSIMLYDNSKPMHASNQLKADQRSKKALGVLAPWKKVKLPNIFFYPIKEDGEHQSMGFFSQSIAW